MSNLAILGTIISLINVILSSIVSVLLFKYKKIVLAKAFLNADATLRVIKGFYIVFVLLLLAVISASLIPSTQIIVAIHIATGTIFQTYVLMLLIAGLERLWGITYGRR